MKWMAALLFILNVIPVVAQNTVNIVPMPAEFKMSKGVFTINRNTVIVAEGRAVEKSVTFINDYLQSIVGYKLKITKKHTGVNAITLNYNRLNNKIPGAYNLTVDKKGIYITGDNEQGIFYGIQTFIQLLPLKKEITNSRNGSSSINQLSINQLSIKDYPRFKYRGMHLDVGRHFMPVSLVKKYIDYLAFYKFNTFHWHLTEDQGWRIEIKKYPKLTGAGGWRNGTIIGAYPGKGNDSQHYGGYYTQTQIKEVVKYAADRFINIIPEIEMPGHSSAAIAAYPQLSCFPGEDTQYPAECAWAGPVKGKQVQQTWGVFEDVFCPTDYTFNFLQDVIDEVIKLFPAEYIHIGGDECPKEAWKRSPFCQQLMKEKGLKNEHELQSYFIQRIEKYINSKGKKIIGWDEILEGGLAPNATVMSWRGIQGGIDAARQHHDVIMTPESPLYLNHSQTKNEDSITQGGYNPLEAVYNYEPIPNELNEKEQVHVLGAQGNLWSEYIQSKSKLEYAIFPRLAALAEVLWTPKANKDWKDFERRMPAIVQRYNQWGANYSNAYFKLEANVLPTENFNGLLWQVKTKSTEPIYINMDNTDSVWTYTTPQLIQATHVVKAYQDKNKPFIFQQFYFNKATGKKITLAIPTSPNYPGSGAFTLVDGIQNKKGLSQSSEFIGFNGTDLDVTIDLQKETDISKITLHVFDQNASWIYLPSQVSVSFSGENNLSNEKTVTISKQVDPIKEKGTTAISIESSQHCRYIHVVAKNFGIIPPGNPGSSNPAWLFADEIEVE